MLFISLEAVRSSRLCRWSLCRGSKEGRLLSSDKVEGRWASLRWDDLERSGVWGSEPCLPERLHPSPLGPTLLTLTEGNCQGCIISFPCSFASLADFELISSEVRPTVAGDKGFLSASPEALCFLQFMAG